MKNTVESFIGADTSVYVEFRIIDEQPKIVNPIEKAQEFICQHIEITGVYVGFDNDRPVYQDDISEDLTDSVMNRFEQACVDFLKAESFCA